MRYFVFLFILSASLFFSCKKDKAVNNPPVDAREKFLGTWDGIYKIQFSNLPANLPPNLLNLLPSELPMTLNITKSDSSASEIIITFQGEGMQNQQATAVVSNNEYIYRPVTLNNNGGTLNLSGSGKISNEDKTITESGTQSVTLPIPGLPLNLNGSWSSVLTKK